MSNKNVTPFNEKQTLNKIKNKSNKNDMTLLFEKALKDKQSKEKSS